jgi:hypothetical protein
MLSIALLRGKQGKGPSRTADGGQIIPAAHHTQKYQSVNARLSYAKLTVCVKKKWVVGMGDDAADASDALTRVSCFQCCCCVSLYSPCSDVCACRLYPRMRTWYVMTCIHIYSIVYACTYFLYVYIAPVEISI